MAAVVEPAAVPPGPRRRAAVDLALWLASAPLVVAVAIALHLSAAPASLRLILGEPLEMIVLLTASSLVLRRRGERWRDLGLRRPASIRRIAALVIGSLVAVYGVAVVLVFAVFRPMGVAPPDLSQVAPSLSTPWGYAAMILLTWTTVAFGEELQFRGFVFSRLERLFGGASRGATVAAWLGQGLLFGLLHVYQGVSGVATTGLVGLALGGVYLATRRNLIACIVIHGTIDTLALTALYYVTTHHLAG
jgi:membrane protease YdiL (CAAX protease family)